MKTHLHLILIYISGLLIVSCSVKKNVLNSDILSDPYLKKIINTPEYEVQILYTSVSLKDTSFNTSTFNINSDKYFYPASTVKMPIAILALQKKNELKSAGIDLKMDDVIMHAAFRRPQTPAFIDTTTENRKPNMMRYIQKIFAVSDNDAYNRLYEFLGQDYINTSLQKIGAFTNSAITHRLSVSGYSTEDNKHTNPVRMFRDDKILYDKPEEYAKRDWLHHAKDVHKGIGYTNDKDSLILMPFDFSKKNFYSIQDMESTIKRVIFPEKFEPEQRFNLTTEDYSFLKKSMSDLPKSYPFYSNKDVYYDSYVKYLLYGDSKADMPTDIKIYNKVGTAYGYLIDCAYIENKDKNVAFFLTAVIHVNKNMIYNDGNYEYNQIGLPFLSKLGKAVYDYEVKIRK